MAASDVNSNYNSAQLQLTKRTGFVTTSIAYTYSKYMGMAGGVGDAYNQNAEPECPYHCLVSTAYNDYDHTMLQPPVCRRPICGRIESSHGYYRWRLSTRVSLCGY